jgi:esterase/lipase superfamily enzyme
MNRFATRLSVTSATLVFLLLSALLPLRALSDVPADATIIAGRVDEAVGSDAAWTVLLGGPHFQQELAVQTDSKGKFVFILKRIPLETPLTICARDAGGEKKRCLATVLKNEVTTGLRVRRDSNNVQATNSVLSLKNNLLSVQNNLYLSAEALFFTDREQTAPTEFANGPPSVATQAFGTFTMNVSRGMSEAVDPNIASVAAGWVCCTSQRDDDAFPSDILTAAKGPAAFDALRDALIQRTQQVGTVLLYIHGFNTSFEGGSETAARVSLLAAPLRHVTLYYSWPSSAELFKYESDVNAAKASVPNLTRLLSILTSLRTRPHIIVVAHSMGAHVLASALVNLAAQNPPRWIDSVILFAADASPDEWKPVEGQFANSPLVYYSNANDIALTMSKCFYNIGQDRIGLLEQYPPPPRLVDLSSTVPYGDFGHYYIVESRSAADDYNKVLNSLQNDDTALKMLPWLDDHSGSGALAFLARASCAFAPTLAQAVGS